MTSQFWAVVPAAGIGRRMEAAVPKQYLEVAGRTVLEHTLSALLDCDRLSRIIVVVAPEDPYWPALGFTHSRIDVGVGGVERCHSVLNGLRALPPDASPEDWVLVHDAARPCVSPEDIERLIARVIGVGGASGGLLGTPIGDTLKRVDHDGFVKDTVPRDGLWRALTPQMFRLKPLRDALDAACSAGKVPTDECQAMEWQGVPPPVMVEGASTNVKVTRGVDLRVVAQYLRHLPQ